MTLRLRNVSAVTVDLGRAGLRCGRVHVTTDRRTRVRLRAADGSVRVVDVPKGERTIRTCSAGNEEREVTCCRPSSYFLLFSPESEVESAAMNASCGTSTRPTIFMRFLPSFCFSRSLRFRVMSPP